MPFDGNKPEVFVSIDTQILQYARDLIAKPGGWCKQPMAVDVDRKPTRVTVDKFGVNYLGAVGYCAMGAIYQAVHDCLKENTDVDRPWDFILSTRRLFGEANGGQSPEALH